MTILLETTHHSLEREPVSHRFTCAFDEDNPKLDSLEHLGGKGFHLKEMTRLGLPVPPGFTVTTDGWREYCSTKSKSLWLETIDQIHHVEHLSNKRFDDPENPLFLSVRSGAPVSMPGVLDSVINVGITDTTITALEQEIGQEAAWTSYYTLIEKLGVSALGIAQYHFDKIYGQHKDDARALVSAAKNLVESKYGVTQIFTSAYVQLEYAMRTVWDSWNSPDAWDFRALHHIPYTDGTAVNIQTMVWGNSVYNGAGSGVMYTRDPRTYGSEPVAVFTPHKQGTDVVSASNEAQHMPVKDLPIEDKNRQRLELYADLLKGHYKSDQDIEFTIDRFGKLWFLQTRNLHLHALAKLRFLQEQMVRGLPLRIAQQQMSVMELRSLLSPSLDPKKVEQAIQKGKLLTTGLGLSLGVATAPVASLEYAIDHPKKHYIIAAILPKNQPYPIQDVPDNVDGIVFNNGSLGSHAVHSLLLGNTRGIPIIFNADISEHRGKLITIDGGTGHIFQGKIPTSTNGARSRVNQGERLLIHDWLQQRTLNPWLYMLPPEESYSPVFLQAQRAMESVKKRGFQSLKAREACVFNAMFPVEMRMDYEPISVRDPQLLEKIMDMAKQSLTNPDHEVTVRTGHVPDRSSGGAWVRLTRIDQIADFITNPDYPGKYGGLPAFFSDNQDDIFRITELLIGRNIPLEKMDMTDSIQHEHVAFTVSMTPSEDIMLQIRPHSAHLRSFEEQDEHMVITIQARYNAKTKRVDIVTRNIGESLISDDHAQEMAQIIEHTVFGEWWNVHQVPLRMAAIQRVFQAKSSPVLEGQFRLSADGRRRWPTPMLYGIKTK